MEILTKPVRKHHKLPEPISDIFLELSMLFYLIQLGKMFLSV